MASNYFQLHKENYKPFTITVDTTIAGSSGVGKFQLPLPSVVDYRFIVDWGDGTKDTITAYNQAETLHDYVATGGTGSSPYTIKISGRCDRFAFENGGDKLKLSTIEAWGNIVWKSGTGMFFGCTNMVANFTDVPILEKISDAASSMANMFRDCTNFNADLSAWDISKATDISQMFRGCTAFNNGGSSGINNWDVSNVTKMAEIFQSATNFNQPLNNWDVSNVTTSGLSNMFNGAAAFNQDISSWDTSNITTMFQMFRGATSYNNGGVALTWNVSNVTNLSWMFFGATNFNADISSWDISSCTNLSRMFQSATNFNQNIGGWNTSNVTNVDAMFYAATAFDQDIGSWDVQACTNYGVFFMSTKTNLTFSSANLAAIYGNGTTTGWAFNGGAGGVLSPNETISFGTADYLVASQAGKDVLLNAPNNWIITDGNAV